MVKSNHSGIDEIFNTFWKTGRDGVAVLMELELMATILSGILDTQATRFLALIEMGRGGIGIELVPSSDPHLLSSLFIFPKFFFL